LEKYKEIDALRGLAILIIVISHFENSFLSYGGVNIFFVLSGFLITKTIYSKGLNFSLFHFYFIRLNSLYPQLLISSFIILIIYLVIGEYDNNSIFFESFFSSTSSTMNLYLISQEHDYNNQKYINPFLPLWAFSVIIQFYIFYPILLKIFFKIDNYFKLNDYRLFYISLVFFIISYLAYLFGHYNESELSNFYSIFSRFWQFLLGANIYFFIRSYKIDHSYIFIIFGTLFLILWQIFPNYLNHISSTLIVSLSTGLMLIGFMNKKKDTRIFIFTSSSLVSLGKISYPIYLWHMPFIYFSTLYFNEISAVFISIILIFIFSHGLYQINQKLFVKNKSKINKLNLLIFIISLLFGLSSLLIKNNSNISNLIINKLIIFQNKYNFYKKLDVKFNEKYSNFSRSIQVGNDGNSCQRNSLDFNNCQFNLNGKNKKIILLGTSHLAAISKSLTTELVSKDHPVTVITPPGCPYTLNFYNYERQACNNNYMKNIRDYIDSYTKPSLIIYLTRYAYYIEGKTKVDPGYELNLPSMLSKSGVDFKTGLKKTFYDILNQGHELVLIYPIPESEKHIPKIYKKNIYKNNFNFYINYEDYISRNESSKRLLDSIKHKNVYKFYPEKFFCKDRKKCITIINDKILYSDHDHLGYHGSEFISKLILDFLFFSNLIKI